MVSPQEGSSVQYANRVESIARELRPTHFGPGDGAWNVLAAATEARAYRADSRLIGVDITLGVARSPIVDLSSVATLLSNTPEQWEQVIRDMREKEQTKNEYGSDDLSEMVEQLSTLSDGERRGMLAEKLVDVIGNYRKRELAWIFTLNENPSEKQPESTLNKGIADFKAIRARYETILERLTTTVGNSTPPETQ